MDTRITFFMFVFSLVLLMLTGGCLGVNGRAETVVKYVCSDGSIVSESKECPAAEKACVCGTEKTAPEQEDKKETPAAAATTSSMAPEAGNISLGPCELMGCPPDARFVGNSETKKFHVCDCAQAAKLSPKKRVCFISAKYAESLGYVPCGFCKPADAKS